MTASVTKMTVTSTAVANDSGVPVGKCTTGLRPGSSDSESEEYRQGIL